MKNTRNNLSSINWDKQIQFNLSTMTTWGLRKVATVKSHIWRLPSCNMTTVLAVFWNFTSTTKLTIVHVLYMQVAGLSQLLSSMQRRYRVTHLLLRLCLELLWIKKWQNTQTLPTGNMQYSNFNVVLQ